MWFKWAAACLTSAEGSITIDGNYLNVLVKTNKQSSSKNLNML